MNIKSFDLTARCESLSLLAGRVLLVTLTVILCSGILCSGKVLADSAPSSLRLELRVIKAHDPIASPVRVGKLVLDKNLSDLTERLSKLPFASFTQLQKVDRDLPIKQKIGFPLCSGQILIVRPIYQEGDRVGLWLRWNDADGAPLIDTRMHIDTRRSILLGNDEEMRESGRILALTLKDISAH